MPRIYVATRTVRELVHVMFRTVAITVALVVGASAPAPAQTTPDMQAFLAQRYAQIDSIAERSPTFAAALDSLIEAMGGTPASEDKATRVSVEVRVNRKTSSR